MCVCVWGGGGRGGGLPQLPNIRHLLTPPHVEGVMMKVENYMLWFTQHFHFFNGSLWFEWSSQQNPNTYIFEVNLHRGRGLGRQLLGSIPTHLRSWMVIPTDKILEGVVQNCRKYPETGKTAEILWTLSVTEIPYSVYCLFCQPSNKKKLKGKEMLNFF